MKKWIKVILVIVGFVLLIALAMLIPPVSDKVGSMVGVGGDKVRSVARLVVGLALGVALITWGIAAIALPWVAVPMIIVGIALIAYNVWPLFSSDSGEMNTALPPKM